MSPDVATPETLEDALALLASGPAWTPVAGGTSLLRAGARPALEAGAVLSLQGLRPELRYVAIQGDRLRIGALATLRDLTRSAILRERVPFLVDALAASGDLAHLNRATVGGHFAGGGAARHLEAWRALGTLLVLRGPSWARRIACDAACLSDGSFARASDELLVSIQATLPARAQKRPAEDAS